MVVERTKHRTCTSETGVCILWEVKINLLFLDLVDLLFSFFFFYLQFLVTVWLSLGNKTTWLGLGKKYSLG